MMHMYSIIIIDGNGAEIRDLMEKTDWNGLKCHVAETAEDGMEGIRKIKRLRPDLILVDSRMPGMGGLELIGRLNRQGYHENVIMMTEERSFEEARQAIQKGVKGLLVKPVDIRELEDTIRRVVKWDVGRIRKADGGFENWAEKQLEEIRGGRGRYSAHIARAIAYIDGHLGEELSLTRLCEDVGLSPAYFSRLFKKETGVGFQAYVQMAKMHRGKELLADSKNKVYQVAEMLGYRNYTYFFQVYKKIYGCAPGSIRKSRRRSGG